MDHNRQGWQQFLQHRKEILNEFESSKVFSVGKPVKVDHGVTFEASIRSWLSEFLPKKYGVTSGYIICQGSTDEVPTLHYDIIIYNQLESPILWIEGSKDYSRDGKKKAIPIEHVKCIIEVKSQLNKKTAEDALNKLSELQPYILLSKFDTHNHFLSENYFSYTIFAESKEDKPSILDVFANKQSIANSKCLGAIVLKNSLNNDETGIIDLIYTDTQQYNLPNDLFKHAYSEPVEFNDGKNWAYSQIYWAQSNFSKFAFDLLALLDNSHQPGVRSSLHGYTNQ